MRVERVQIPRGRRKVFLSSSFWLFAAPVLILLWPASVAYAQYRSDIYSARVLGMGGASRAWPSDGRALSLNPAAMAFFHSYQTEGYYRLYNSEGAHLVGVSFVDAVTSKVASGTSLDFEWASAMPGLEKSGWLIVGEPAYETLAYRSLDYRLGFALPFSDRIAAGTTLLWHRQKKSVEEALDDSSYQSKVTLNVGTLFKPAPHVNLALVGTNLIPTHLSGLPTTIDAGAWVSAGDVAAAAFDLVLDLTGARDVAAETGSSGSGAALDVHAGIVALAGKYFPIRAGFYTEKSTDSKYLTIGAGVENAQTRIGYALRYRLNDGDTSPDGRFYHMFQLGIVISK